MKKTTTAVDQPGKTETTPAIHVRQHSASKLHRHDHKYQDHLHGRVNRNAIWLNFGPGIN